MRQNALPHRGPICLWNLVAGEGRPALLWLSTHGHRSGGRRIENLSNEHLRTIAGVNHGTSSAHERGSQQVREISLSFEKCRDCAGGHRALRLAKLLPSEKEMRLVL